MTRIKQLSQCYLKVKEPLEVPNELNHTWSMDFVTDVFENKRRYRAFNIIDDYNREVLFEEADFSLTSLKLPYYISKNIFKIKATVLFF